MEPNASIEPIVANRVLQYDAASEVPEEYDPLCEGCGCSLVEITTDRCPECGKTIRADQLPFARVPWLHRRKIGRLRAYVRTFRRVLLEPREFATELCRPVRISIVDARLFRRTSIWIATAALAAVLLVFYALGSIDLMHRFARRGFPGARMILQLAPVVVVSMTALVACHIFFRAITDLPVFIWKGHPSLRPTELAPIHCYAAAPLALVVMTPALVLPLIALMVLRIAIPITSERILLALLQIAFWILLAVWLVTMLTTTVRLMIGAGVERRRAWIMAAYLPVHWIMMAFVCSGCCAIVIFLEIWIFEQLERWTF